MAANNSPPANTAPTTPEQKPLRSRNSLLHYAAYFAGVASLVFIARTNEPKQIETALLAGAISATSVVSRDWYKARLSPSMAEDPTALISLFSEMLHAGRAQANTNAAQLKRVEFLQTDLVEAMRELNNRLRLDPAEVEKRIKAIQAEHLTSTLPALNGSLPLMENTGGNAKGSAVHSSNAVGATYIPDSTTLHQSESLRRPGFDA
ncbi:MAG: hypothetical protein AAF171_02025 [Cyanobacteria bacterium P01_A01_bin.116]